jgi:hypothetical protein
MERPGDMEKTGMEKLDYSKLEADVNAWRDDFIDRVRREQGDEAGDEAVAEFEGNPWLALEWYVDCSQGH